MDHIPKILLIDDEERFVTSLHTILKHYNYNCTKALSGGEAIRLLAEEDFDLALLDVGLPDMSGCDVLDIIKKSEKNTTVIMLTGISTIETAVRAMKQGAYDFLNKPIHHELLIKSIQKALQHNQMLLELNRSEKRFQVLAQATSEGIVIHNDGRFIEANQQFFSMFGYSEAELREGIFLEMILDSASLNFALQRIKNSVGGNHQGIGVKKSGLKFPFEATTHSINYLGKPARVCTIRDLSERVKAEAERFELYKKLEKANKLNALGLMAGSVAHDLNNILVGVVSYPDLLLSQMLESDKFYPQIKKIQEAGKRAVAVVNDLITLARGGTFTTTVENINDILMNHLNSIEHCSRLADYPDVVIQTKLQKNLHNTPCSQQQINKVFLNLIGNALEAVREDGLIRITTENCKFTHPKTKDAPTAGGDDYIKISIADNGPGISQNNLDHIFEPFFTTKTMGKSGTGLGLSIVWNSIQEHKGWIEVKNLHPGIIFEIYLPATEEKLSRKKHQAIKLTALGNGEKILLIDDQLEQIETVERMLTRLGYTVHSVIGGEKGIAFLQSQEVDLVLLDMIMSTGLNGWETYEKILQIRPGQKAIIITGYSTTEHLLKAKTLGISQFLEKPVSLANLNSAIRKTLYPN
ncbi:MAG: signal transduction histidine kinase [uncultured bacterium]|nr:MAG: signal transduction histidine kinase [uncultured bacterium]